MYKRELTVEDYPSSPTNNPEKVLEGIVNRGDEKTWVEVGFFQEKDGKWSASTGNLLEDTLFIVKATKKKNKEALWLAQARVVLVRPNPAPTVGAKALSISANSEGMVTVNGT